jgi:hypothetical protein
MIVWIYLHGAGVGIGVLRETLRRDSVDTYIS